MLEFINVFFWDEREVIYYEGLMGCMPEEEPLSENLRNEDLVYFTFLISIVIIIISSDISEKINNSLYGVIFDLTIYFIAFIIIFFAFMRFFAVVFESLLCRYFSIHGLLISFITIPLYFFYILLYYLTLNFFQEKYLGISANIVSLIMLFPFFFVMILIVPVVFCKLIHERLLNTNKYLNLKRRYKMGSLTFYFYFMLLGISVFFIFAILFGNSVLTYFYSAFGLFFSLISVYGFIKIKNNQGTIKMMSLSGSIPLFSRFFRWIFKKIG